MKKKVGFNDSTCTVKAMINCPHSINVFDVVLILQPSNLLPVQAITLYF